MTLDGAPRGVYPPILTVINATALQVEWTEPEQPNGVIISYNILLDDMSIYTNNISGTFIVVNLLPFTVYSFQVSLNSVFDLTMHSQIIYVLPTFVNLFHILYARQFFCFRY